MFIMLKNNIKLSQLKNEDVNQGIIEGSQILHFILLLFQLH